MKTKTPALILTEHWAVDTDDLNWILYRRNKDKDGNLTTWKANYFYSRPEQLFKGLQRKLERESFDGDLDKTLKHALRLSETCRRTFAAAIDDMGPVAKLRPRRLVA